MPRLVVLGNAAEYLQPLSGGSGYLFESDRARILLDCGPGIRAALAVRGTPIDAVVVSHFHYDHALDLLPIVASLDPGTPVFGPPGAAGNLASLGRAFQFEGDFATPGPLVEARDGPEYEVKDLRLDFLATRHSAGAFATRVRAGSRTFVYASDTAPFEALADFARGADLLLMHTLLPEVEPGSDHAKIHATAESAGTLAARAGARRLLLSHRFHGSRDPEMLARAQNVFPGVELATTGASYELA